MCSRGYMGLAGTKIKLVQILVQAPVPDLIWIHQVVIAAKQEEIPIAYTFHTLQRMYNFWSYTFVQVSQFKT
jgi:hypothetical protein